MALHVTFTLAGAGIANVSVGAIVPAFASASVAPAALARAIGYAFLPAVQIYGLVVHAALENEQTNTN